MQDLRQRVRGRRSELLYFRPTSGSVIREQQVWCLQDSVGCLEYGKHQFRNFGTQIRRERKAGVLELYFEGLDDDFETSQGWYKCLNTEYSERSDFWSVMKCES